jgi:hypothetical protein
MSPKAALQADHYRHSNLKYRVKCVVILHDQPEGLRMEKGTETLFRGESDDLTQITFRMKTSMLQNDRVIKTSCHG